MKRIFILLLLSISLSIGSGEAFADRRHPEGPRHEQGGRKNHNNNSERPGNPKNDKNFKGQPKGQDHNRPKDHNGPKGRPNGNNHHNGHNGPNHHNPNPYRPGMSSMPAPGMGSMPAPGRPLPPPPPPAPAPVPIPNMLQQMVMNATYGCYDINVWQVTPDSYIVKYRRGNRLYTRMVYPYAGMYGNETLISVNWQPLNPWTLIPPIQLNINL